MLIKSQQNQTPFPITISSKKNSSINLGEKYLESEERRRKIKDNYWEEENEHQEQSLSQLYQPPKNRECKSSKIEEESIYDSKFDPKQAFKQPKLKGKRTSSTEASNTVEIEASQKVKGNRGETEKRNKSRKGFSSNQNSLKRIQINKVIRKLGFFKFNPNVPFYHQFEPEELSLLNEQEIEYLVRISFSLDREKMQFINAHVSMMSQTDYTNPRETYGNGYLKRNRITNEQFLHSLFNRNSDSWDI